ncbi:gamma-glutamyl-gamma-aminobutyrate hydrolase family protein [Heyndrickxia sporothermodurans]
MLSYTVHIHKDSRLYEIFDEEKIYTNSFHHQSLHHLGEHLKATSYSEDGIIEAVESTLDQYVKGVQWHPECMTKCLPIQLKVFSYCIQEAHKYKEKKALSHIK